MVAENYNCEVFSPPYPRRNCTANQLREQLVELYNWVSVQQDWANVTASDLNAPTPWLATIPSIPVAAKFEQTAVADLFYTWQAVRRLREKFDNVVRNYETADEWQSAPALFFRLSLLRAARDIIALASLSFEHREAKAQAELEQRRKEVLQELRKFLNEEDAENAGEQDADTADNWWV